MSFCSSGWPERRSTRPSVGGSTSLCKVRRAAGECGAATACICSGRCGSVLRAAERRKHTVYPELTHSGPQPLVGLAPALDHDQATRPCQCAFHARTPPSCGSLWLRAAIQPSLPRAAAALATPRVGFLSISYSSCPSCAKSPLSYPFARILYAALGVQLVR